VNDKFLAMCGICRKAGKTVVGTNLSTEAVKRGQTNLVICASDIAKNSEKEIVRACEASGTRLYRTSYTKEVLGESLGFNEVAVFAVADSNFAKALLNIISTNAENGGTN